MPLPFSTGDPSDVQTEDGQGAVSLKRPSNGELLTYRPICAKQFSPTETVALDVDQPGEAAGQSIERRGIDL